MSSNYVISGSFSVSDYTYIQSNGGEDVTTCNYGGTYDFTAIPQTPGPCGSATISKLSLVSNATIATLALSATAYSGSTVTSMRFSNDKTIWSAWEPYAVTKMWNMGTDIPVGTVYVQFQDSSSRVSRTYPVPNVFAFTDQTGVALSSTITSNTINVSWLTAAASISINGGTYAINGGAYTSSGGTVVNGDVVTVQQTSSARNSTTTNAILTIDRVSDVFSVTTLDDTMPDAFSFINQTGVALNSIITSNTIKVSGINAATSISITGGTYAINGGVYTSAGGTVVNGDDVTVRQRAASSRSTTTNATLTIGAVSDTFSVSTIDNSSPNPFTFADQTGVALSMLITSNTIAVSDINTATGIISITGGAYSINCGAYTSAGGTVKNGDTVTVQQTSWNSYLTTTNATLTIGGVSDTFSVTTQDAPGANAWTSKTAFGGTARSYAVGFSIGSKGYIGTGKDTAGVKRDFWEYDPAVNTWTQKADFGGTARSYAVGFSIGSKGYIGTGRATDGDKKDFWEYDPDLNAWTQKADFGGTARIGAVGFSIGSSGYIGTGKNDSSSFTRDFWQFDPAINTWTRKADFGGTSRYWAAGFSMGSHGYIGTGYYSKNSPYSKNDFWKYDPVTDAWTQKADFGGIARYSAVGFSIASRGYIGTGYAIDGYKKDYGEYCPDGVFDTTPDVFTFADQTGVALNTLIASNTITVSGINKPAPIFITGDTYSINGSAYTSESGTVNEGDNVTVKQFSSTSYSTQTNATMTISGLSETFSVTTLTLNQYAVTPSAGSNGTISPATVQTVNHGATTTFTVTPNTGYTATVGGTCGGTLTGTTYTTNAITSACTVAATFTLNQYAVTPSAGTGGTISPSTVQTVNHGATTTFTATPTTGYTATVGGTCGGTLNGTTYTTNAITGACTVAATFTLNQYAVTPSAGTGGTISPSTVQTVNHGATTTFTVTPNTGYTATVGGTCGGTLTGTTYTTNAITSACTVAATFGQSESFGNLYASFANAGIWKYDGTDWTQTTASNPQLLVTVGSDLYGTFEGLGIWKFNGTDWTQTTTSVPQMIVGSSATLYGTFSGLGIWQWNGSAWTQTTASNPQKVVASTVDLYGTFAGLGIWKWNGTTWTQLTTSIPDLLVTSGEKLYGTFAGLGIWLWNGTQWAQATPNTPQMIAANSTTLYGTFEGQGIWSWDGASTWTKISTENPTKMVASGTELYAAFAGTGISKWDGTAWTLISGSEPVRMVVGK